MSSINPKPSKTILHVDINSYFATMIQQKYPKLRGKPVGVLKDIGRTCVIAASKEAKALGVKTGSSAKEAKQLAPNIIFAPAEFDLCLSATQKLASLFHYIAPSVEIFSLDEAFINITNCQKNLYPDSHQLARTIKTKIKQTLGSWVTANIGISHNRFLAKLGSELAAKDSITTIDHTNQDQFLSTTDFSSVCGVGIRLEARLKKLGVNNLYALNFVSDQELHEEFGPFWSIQLRRMSKGLEPHLFSLINRNPHMKSVGRSITGYKLENRDQHIKSVLHNLTQEIIYKVRKMHLAGRQVWIGLYGPKHQISWKAHLTLNHYINHTQEMFHYLYHQLYQRDQPNFPIIKFAVRLGLLKPISTISASLLPSWHRQENLSCALDHISNKYGLFTVHSGLLLNKQIIYPEVTGFLGDKLYHLGGA